MEGTLRGLKSSKYEATWAVNDETLGEFKTFFVRQNIYAEIIMKKYYEKILGWR